jgi:hypothetical protein
LTRFSLIRVSDTFDPFDFKLSVSSRKRCNNVLVKLAFLLVSTIIGERSALIAFSFSAVVAVITS